MRLSHDKHGVLLRAVEDSFNVLEIERLLSDRLALTIERVSNRYQPIGHIALDITGHFNRHNTAEQLIAALRDARPAVAAFAELADAAGFTRLPPSSALEVFVRATAKPYQDVGSFRRGLSGREAAVCLVEAGQAIGTGILVAPDIVLTNHHVVAGSIYADNRLHKAITCLFDHVRATGGFITPGSTAAVTAVLASSPHSEEDARPPAETVDQGKLDYALLKLERPVGNEPIVAGFDVRGFVSPGTRTQDPAVNEGVLILQHPRGEPMKIDIGSLTSVGAARLRHTANTEPGSSGSPIFDAELNLVGLHHVGVDWPTPQPPYNQAIPMKLIVADALRRGIAL